MKLIAILIILVNCTSVVNGEIGFCYCHSCSENEGDCDSHDECQDGLACGSNNCPASLDFDSEMDCCYHPTAGCKPQRIILMWKKFIINTNFVFFNSLLSNTQHLAREWC